MLHKIPLIPQDSALYRNDRELIDRMLNHPGEPKPSHITDAARLFIRYRDTTHLDLITDLLHACDQWDMSINTVQERAKEIWTSGWRPGGYSAVTVGSGAESEEL